MCVLVKDDLRGEYKMQTTIKSARIGVEFILNNPDVPNIIQTWEKKLKEAVEILKGLEDE